MSTLSMLPQILMSYLQKQNVKREIAKKLDIIEQIIPLNIEQKVNKNKSVIDLNEKVVN